MKKFTIGEVFRLGLLKDHTGKPYKHKSTVSNVIAKMEYQEVKSPWGPSKLISEEQIKKHNQRWQ